MAVLEAEQKDSATVQVHFQGSDSLGLNRGCRYAQLSRTGQVWCCPSCQQLCGICFQLLLWQVGTRLLPFPSIGMRHLGNLLFLGVLCFNNLRAKEGTQFLQGGDGDGYRVEPGVCAASFLCQSSVVSSCPRLQNSRLGSSPGR